MNLVITIFIPDKQQRYDNILSRYNIPSLALFSGKGTAIQDVLDLLGIKNNQRKIGFTVIEENNTTNLFNDLRNELYIGIPGQGLVMSIPIKAIGGKQNMAKLNAKKSKPNLNFEYELIVAITQEGRNSEVMNAAREAGASGGTIIHGKGTNDFDSEHFHQISIGSEKEIIFIVARSENKAEIMKNILQKAGPDSKAQTVLFSLPVNEVGGFTLSEAFKQS